MIVIYCSVLFSSLDVGWKLMFVFYFLGDNTSVAKNCHQLKKVLNYKVEHWSKSKRAGFLPSHFVDGVTIAAITLRQPQMSTRHEATNLSKY